jgi:TonB family protein
VKKTYILSIIFFSFCKILFAQNVLYFDENMSIVEKWKYATYQRNYQFNKDSTSITFEDYFIEKNLIVQSGTMQNADNGEFTFYQNGNKFSSGRIINGKYEGNWKFYYYYFPNVIKEEQEFKNGIKTGYVTQYFLSGKKHLKGLLINDKRDGEVELYSETAETKAVCNYINDKLNGPSIVYNFNGKKLFERNYLDDKPIGTWKKYDSLENIICEVDFGRDTSKKIKENCFNYFMKDSLNKEEMPSYIGGEEKMYDFIANHLKYPAKARDNQTEGRILITFTIDESGDIKNLYIKKDIGDYCGESAMYVISQMPRWNPGIQNGKPVQVEYTVPVQFSLQ